jgi:hypothetical protein
MPIPARVSVVALRTADLPVDGVLRRAGRELSPASTAAMSLFKTGRQPCWSATDDLPSTSAASRWPPRWRASRPAKLCCPSTLASDAEVDAALQEATGAVGWW